MYLERWTEKLYTIIEKRKGLILGKLQITQLIEADFKLIIRICINITIEE